MELSLAVLQEAALLALGLALTAAAWQDVKTREVDVRIFAAAGAAAAALMWLNWGNPLYTLSLAVGALLALLTRLSGAGYADSTALALISTALPVAFLPAPFTAPAPCCFRRLCCGSTRRTAATPAR